MQAVAEAVGALLLAVAAAVLAIVGVEVETSREDDRTVRRVPTAASTPGHPVRDPQHAVVVECPDLPATVVLT